MKNTVMKHVKIERFYELIYRKKGRLMKTVDRYYDFESARTDYKYLIEQDDTEYDYVALDDVTVEKNINYFYSRYLTTIITEGK